MRRLEALRNVADPLSTARATAVHRPHRTIHLYKEDVHRYPILKERTTEREQASIVSLMGKPLPPEK